MKILKTIGLILLLVAVSLVSTGVYVKQALPDTGPAPVLHIENTAERIAHGDYLANHVAVCMDCHSKRDWQLPSGPVTPGSLGAGGEAFLREKGYPGDFYASNLTPYFLGDWTDGEIFRAITSGVGKDGRALFPIMAYHRYGKMDESDVRDIIAYLRNLTPVANKVPKSKPGFLAGLVLKTLSKKPSFIPRPSPADTLAYGAYLVNLAGCMECHSKVGLKGIKAGTEFRGGMEFHMSGGTVRAPNITFDKATGIGNWTKELFINRFRFYADSSYQPVALGSKDINTPMPWTRYAGMTEADLGAIYEYIKTWQPVTHQVVRYTKK